MKLSIVDTDGRTVTNCWGSIVAGGSKSPAKVWVKPNHTILNRPPANAKGSPHICGF